MSTPPRTEPPFLTVHSAVVLVAALLAGLVVGALSYLGGIPPALCVLAGLSGTGGAVPVLRTLIG
ncbi:hypothetical protein [Streptomyces sp. NPDC046685]|uniref:hypothetical protein n=1 Tax=Streptomyces sp. NPDC046685 TaxID=3157202 RepID=UPI0033C1427E